MTDLSTFSGMPGTKGQLQGPMVGSAASAVKAMKSHRVCSAASDHGSITVWRDDDGNLRAVFHRFMSSKGEDIFLSAAALRRWLDAWWPAMSDEDYRPVSP